MAMWQWVAGAAALAVGYVVTRPKKKSSTVTTTSKPAGGGGSGGGCPPSAVTGWAESRELFGSIVSTRADLDDIEPEGEVDPRDIAVVMSECAVYRWQGSAWVRDAGLTRDMIATF